jgi:hypothetical protein
MKKSDQKKLSETVTQYLQLKELTASQETQMDELKKIVRDIADANPKDFQNGELALEGIGLLKFVQNPPKIVYAASGRTLNEIETIGLATELEKIGVGFQKVSVNVKKVQNLIEAKNPALIALLNSNGIELIQESRLDIKAVK